MTYDYTFGFKLKLFIKFFFKATKFWYFSNATQEVDIRVGARHRVVGTVGKKRLRMKDFSVIKYDIKKTLKIFKK